MKLLNKYFIIILLLLIINILLYVFISENINNDGDELDKINYKQTIPDSKLEAGVYEFNMYYTKWCQYSQKAKPGFEDLKVAINKINPNKTKPYIKVNLINVEDNNNNIQIKENLKYLNIKSYPTILLLDSNTRLITMYTGKRDINSYNKFLLENIPTLKLS